MYRIWQWHNIYMYTHWHIEHFLRRRQNAQTSIIVRWFDGVHGTSMMFMQKCILHCCAWAFVQMGHHSKNLLDRPTPRVRVHSEYHVSNRVRLNDFGWNVSQTSRAFCNERDVQFACDDSVLSTASSTRTIILHILLNSRMFFASPGENI